MGCQGVREEVKLIRHRLAHVISPHPAPALLKVHQVPTLPGGLDPSLRRRAVQPESAGHRVNRHSVDLDRHQVPDRLDGFPYRPRDGCPHPVGDQVGHQVPNGQVVLLGGDDAARLVPFAVQLVQDGVSLDEPGSSAEVANKARSEATEASGGHIVSVEEFEVALDDRGWRAGLYCLRRRSGSPRPRMQRHGRPDENLVESLVICSLAGTVAEKMGTGTDNPEGAGLVPLPDDLAKRAGIDTWLAQGFGPQVRP
jgi:hypothetical protein